MTPSSTDSFEIKPPPDHRSARGRAAEDLAAEIYTTHGFTVIARNFRGGRGELDLVCRRGPLVVFVEVRGARGAGFGLALESVRPDKLYRLRTAARAWLARHGLPGVECRFDLIAFELAADGRALRHEILEGISQ